MKITEIKITKLFGFNSYSINLKDNKLILVAENGGGKTTILKMIYYFLTKQWHNLSKFDFNNMSVVIDNVEYVFDKSILEQKTEKLLIENIVNISQNKNELFKIFAEYDFDKLKYDNFLIESIELENFWRKGQLAEVIEKIIIESKIEDKFPNFNNIPIIFLPTYRRTENEFMNIFSSLNNKELISKLNNFIETTNKYFANSKKLEYLNSENKLIIKLNNNIIIKLSDLSSGEKQIISIFSYLYLSEKNYFIIFDEPETSISIFWQKTLLSDICKTNINGIIAATHSPYIYKNDLFEYVNGLDNFLQTQ